MPGFNGTGPDRAGQMSGGGRGYCIVPVEGINLTTVRERARRFGATLLNRVAPEGKTGCGGRKRSRCRVGNNWYYNEK